MKRVPKGRPEGGRFAPDPTFGSPPPSPQQSQLPLDGLPQVQQPLDDVYVAFQNSAPGDAQLHSSSPLDQEIPALPAEGEPVRVILLRGIPGSGKTTWAKMVQSHYPAGAVARINNDDLTAMLFGSTNTNFTPNVGKTLETLRSKMLDSLLRNPSVKMVIVDNTNLNTRPIGALEQVALNNGADIEVDDRFLSVPLETCLQRNALREDPVPESVVLKMGRQARRLTPWASSIPATQPYHNDPALPHSIIVDIDGTLAQMHPGRSPYEWSKVGMDSPNPSVVSAVKAMRSSGVEVIIMSGRDGSCRGETERWLEEHVGENLTLHMRAAGDSRPDHLVKHELFSDHVADKYHVKCVFDDRDQVVNLWRRRLGLPTFQVAEGDF